MWLVSYECSCTSGFLSCIPSSCIRLYPLDCIQLLSTAVLFCVVIELWLNQSVYFGRNGGLQSPFFASSPLADPGGGGGDQGRPQFYLIVCSVQEEYGHIIGWGPHPSPWKLVPPSGKSWIRGVNCKLTMV